MWTKSTRRRIVCPARDPSEAVSLPTLSAQPKPSALGPARAARAARALKVTVRALYFSHDGSQADAGAQVALELSTESTVEELLAEARTAIGCSKGRLLFRMRPLKDPKERQPTLQTHWKRFEINSHPLEWAGKQI